MSGRRPSQLYVKLAQSVVSASFGAALGYAYARWRLPPEVQASARYLLGVYASAGAVVGVVAFRLGVLAREIISDYLGRE